MGVAVQDLLKRLAISNDAEGIRLNVFPLSTANVVYCMLSIEAYALESSRHEMSFKYQLSLSWQAIKYAVSITGSLHAARLRDWGPLLTISV
jgi:hypothetical protein